MIARVRREILGLPVSKPSPKSSASTERTRNAFFGPSSLLSNENAVDYEHFLQQVLKAIQPSGILEEIWAPRLHLSRMGPSSFAPRIEQGIRQGFGETNRKFPSKINVQLGHLELIG